MRSYWKFSEATICRHIEKNIGDRLSSRFMKQYSEQITKTICSTKEKYPTTNEALSRKDGKLLCKKSNGNGMYSRPCKDIIQRVTITWMRCRTFSLRFACFGLFVTGYNTSQSIFLKNINKYIFHKFDGNAW